MIALQTMKRAVMRRRDPRSLIEKLKTLSPERMAEVEDFIDFLRARQQHSALVRVAARVAEPTFAKVWNNERDSAYDWL